MPLPSGFIAPAQLVLGEGPIYRTSRPYPVQNLESMTIGLIVGDGEEPPSFIESVDTAIIVANGTLVVPLVTYDEYEPESVDTAIVVGNGTIAIPLVTYDEYEPESVDTAIVVANGTLVVALIEYEEYDAESMDTTLTVSDGTLV